MYRKFTNNAAEEIFFKYEKFSIYQPQFFGHVTGNIIIFLGLAVQQNQ
jgi:hypothetical protein